MNHVFKSGLAVSLAVCAAQRGSMEEAVAKIAEPQLRLRVQELITALPELEVTG